MATDRQSRLGPDVIRWLLTDTSRWVDGDARAYLLPVGAPFEPDDLALVKRFAVASAPLTGRRLRLAEETPGWLTARLTAEPTEMASLRAWKRQSVHGEGVAVYLDGRFVAYNDFGGPMAALDAGHLDSLRWRVEHLDRRGVAEAAAGVGLVALGGRRRAVVAAASIAAATVGYIGRRVFARTPARLTVYWSADGIATVDIPADPAVFGGAP